MEVNKEQGEFTYIIYKNNSLQELILFFPVIKWKFNFFCREISHIALQFFIPGEGRGHAVLPCRASLIFLTAFLLRILSGHYPQRWTEYQTLQTQIHTYVRGRSDRMAADLVPALPEVPGANDRE